MYPDPEKEETEDTRIENEWERCWRKIFEDNSRGIYDEKEFLHSKIWDVYMCEKLSLSQGGYYVEMSGYYVKKGIWEVVDDHVVEEPKDNGDIGLRVFDF